MAQTRLPPALTLEPRCRSSAQLTCRAPAQLGRRAGERAHRAVAASSALTASAQTRVGGALTGSSPGIAARRPRATRALIRRGGPEILDIEGEHGAVLTFGNRHHCCIGEPQVEGVEPLVDLRCPTEELRRQVGDLVLACRHRPKEQPSRPDTDVCPQQPVGLHEHRRRDHQGSTQLDDQRCRQPAVHRRRPRFVMCGAGHGPRRAESRLPRVGLSWRER